MSGVYDHSYIWGSTVLYLVFGKCRLDMEASDTSGATDDHSRIHRIISALDITASEDVKDTAQNICEDAAETTLGHGISEGRIESAAVCLACRIEGEPWGAKDIAKVSDVSKQHIRSTSWKINSTLSIEVPPHDPSAYIDRYCAELGVSTEVKELAYNILESCPPHFNSGTPTGIAASAIYGASSQLDRNLTQREIAKTADVSEVTIRNWYPKQIEHYKQTQA